MTSSDPTSPRIALNKIKIAEQMKKISDQRKLIADLEAQGKSARPERDLLKELLSTLEGILAGLRQHHDRVDQDDSIVRQSDREPV